MILASTALIVVSFIVALYSKKLGNNEIYINIGQNCLPIIMLALSILVSGAKYGTRAEKIHECAQDLNNLKKILNYDINDISFTPSRDNFYNYTKKYADIISRYENHSKTDSISEKLRTIKCKKSTQFALEILANIMGRGVIYFFYIFLSALSVGWMVLGIYLAIRGV